MNIWAIRSLCQAAEAELGALLDCPPLCLLRGSGPASVGRTEGHGPSHKTQQQGGSRLPGCREGGGLPPTPILILIIRFPTPEAPYLLRVVWGSLHFPESEAGVPARGWRLYLTFLNLYCYGSLPSRRARVNGLRPWGERSRGQFGSQRRGEDHIKRACRRPAGRDLLGSEQAFSSPAQPFRRK